ncbi:MAG TPA: hypothetical protein VFE38_10790 [Edaphobacter sp.]|nr:hypothetical protein [Edaphobacter sp.]
MLLLTFTVFVSLTGALVILRLRWTHLTPRTHRVLIRCACAVIVFYLLITASRWSTSSSHLNAFIYWAAIAAYEFFLLLFTLLRPRWLTVLIAIVLLLPLLSASAFLPLAELFDPAPHTITSIGLNLITDRVPWGSGGKGSSGTDIAVYSHPSWTHLLQRRRQASRYYNSQCDANRATATLEPDGRHVLMSCPAAPGQPPESAHNLVVKLY